MATTADRIKEAMAFRDMTQADLAKATGISKGALSSYISGRYLPKQNNTYLIAKALNVSDAWLMGADVPMDRYSPAAAEPDDGVPDTIAAHFDGDKFTADELEEINQFINFVKSKRKS